MLKNMDIHNHNTQKKLNLHVQHCNTGHQLQSPIRVEGINTTGCCLVPRGDRSRKLLITTPVPCSPRHDASHLGLGG
jgi:hypothetical protein